MNFYFVAPNNGIVKIHNNCVVKDMEIASYTSCNGSFIQSLIISNVDTFKSYYYAGDTLLFRVSYSYNNSEHLSQGLPFHIDFQTSQLSAENSILDYVISNANRTASTYFDKANKTIHVYPNANTAYLNTSLKVSTEVRVYKDNMLLSSLQNISTFNYYSTIYLKVVALNGSISNWQIISHYTQKAENNITV